MTPSDQPRVLTPEALQDLCAMGLTSRWVDGPVGLHLLEYGAGNERPVVIVPGISTAAVGLDFVAAPLAARHRILVLDVRGRGLSQAGEGYTLTEYAEDVEAVVNQLGLDRPILIGHSMGARIVAFVAARGRVTLGGTVVVDPPTSGPGREPYPTTRGTFLEQLAQAQRGTTADEVAQSWPRWPRREQELRARWLATCTERAIAETHEGFEKEDFFAFWGNVPAPTSFLYGERSPVVLPSAVAESRTLNAKAEYVVIPEAGHMVFWDNPNAAIAATLAAVDAMAGTGVE